MKRERMYKILNGQEGGEDWRVSFIMFFQHVACVKVFFVLGVGGYFSGGRA